MLYFQKEYRKALIDALEEIYKSNGIVIAFNILYPYYMPSKLVNLVGWSVMDVEILCSHYGKQHEVNGKSLDPPIIPELIKHDMFLFKIQSTSDWMDKNFMDL